MPNAVELIERKRDGQSLTDDEIRWLIVAYTGGSVTEYQMSAMAMAVYLNGLDGAELAAWTDAMLHSGEILDFSDIDERKIDKHSTGGVGDKVSIPLAPMVASCGVAVPMMSGRGLGHTGGTLDKLESIPGFRTNLDPGEFRSMMHSCGMVFAGQSETLAPADRKLYALRDATGTVSSIPLIASSIMSKKLAEGLDGLVLDVKFGAGAFLSEPDRARLLAETMVAIGSAHGVETVAFLTSMENPLGREVGNASEIRESLSVLKGDGPGDLVEVTMALGVEMLLLGGVASDADAARQQLEQCIRDGSAIELFERIIEAQGGDPRVVSEPDILPRAPRSHIVTADRAGYLAGWDARRIGVAAMRLGAGRERKEDTIDPGVGITLLAVPGNELEAGTPILELRFRHEARLGEALRVVDGADTITDESPADLPLILDRVTA